MYIVLKGLSVDRKGLTKHHFSSDIWFCFQIWVICTSVEHLRVLTIFTKCSIIGVWQCSEYASGSQYARVLNIPLGSQHPHILVFWLCSAFSICQSSEYTRILNMLGFWKCKVHTGPEYTWLCQDIPEYAWIYLNLS